jgi:hypothetical protein
MRTLIEVRGLYLPWDADFAQTFAHVKLPQIKKPAALVCQHIEDVRE